MFEHWLTLQFPGLRGWNKNILHCDSHHLEEAPLPQYDDDMVLTHNFLTNSIKSQRGMSIRTSQLPPTAPTSQKINPSEKSSPSNLQNLNLQPTKIRSEAFSNRHTLPKLTVRPWKWMVGRWFISSWEWPIFRGRYVSFKEGFLPDVWQAS